MKKQKLFAFTIALFSFFSGLQSSAQNTMELKSSKDTWVFSEPNNITKNFDTDPKLTLISYTYSGKVGTGRTYLDFNLDSIPQGAEILEVQLKLFGYVDNQPTHVHEGDNKFSIQRVISDWNEKTINWNSQPNSTTDNQIIINRTSTSPTEDYTIDVTEMVKVMYANRATNFGMKLQFLDEQPKKQLAFTSTANPRKDKHPKLVIKYNVGVPSDIKTSAIDPAEYCAGDTVYVSYTTQKDFASDNVFTTVLSDAKGSFDVPNIIGSNKGISSGTILSILPNDLAAGSAYRVRVISSNPQQVGSTSPTALTIKPAPPKPIITKNGNILVSSASSGNRWYDENGAIPGATDRAFIATRTGNYYVVVTQNGCSTRSEVFVFTDRNKLLSGGQSFAFYPNPASQTLKVKAGQPCSLEIYNLLGIRVMTYPIHATEQSIDIASLPKGAYVVKFVISEEESLIERLFID